MKKVIFSMAALATLTLASCGRKTDNTAADDATMTEEVVVSETIEAIPTTDAEGTSIMDKIKGAASKENVQKGIDYVKGLISQGKLSEAKGYLEQLKPYAEKVGMSNVVSTVETTLSKAESLGGDAKDKAEQAVSDAKDKVADAARNAVDDAKAKAGEAAENAKAKAAEAAENAKAKAAEALGGLGK